MRIGMICPYSFDYPGGVQAHILDLAGVLMEQGHHVEVLGPGTNAAEVPDFVKLGGRTVALRYNGSVARISFGPRTFRSTRRFLREGNFDVVHIHEPNSPSYSLAALIVSRAPIVATYHASATSSVALRVARPILRPWLEKIQAGISVSEMARRWQVEQLGGDPLLIPNGVDTARFRQAYDDGVVRPAGGGDPIRIAFLGRLDEPRKGLDVFLNALNHMTQAVQVTVMGDGAPRDVQGSQHRVDFVGRVSDEDKAEILAGADVYVAPNTGGESFGIVLVEAMAAGCAVVASDLEAFSAVCDAQSATPAGLLFPVGDSAALAQCLDALCVDPGRRAALVAAGRARAQLYDWEHVAAQILAVYEAATGHPVGSGENT